MDRGGVKRPRSGTPDNTTTSKKKDKDKTKKKKKNKPTTKNKSDGGDHDNTNSLESTATADGQYMAKILSTFSKMEQSRFEAFKRVSFPCNAISQYVAFCLAERQQPQRQRHEATNPNVNKLFAAGTNEAPQLQDLVVPGQEEEITTVVATLAKVYAQRLCAAAKTQQQQQQQQNGGSSADNDAVALQPEHVLQAFYARQQQGQDPGFFLQPNDCITIGAAVGAGGEGGDTSATNREQMKRVAALAAQDDFDRCLEDYKEFLKKEATKPPPQPPKKEESASNNKKENTKKSKKKKKKKIGDSDSDDSEFDLDMALEDS